MVSDALSDPLETWPLVIDPDSLPLSPLRLTPEPERGA
jgi:hypothetical protein